jgi:hypothetical protein
MLMHADKEVKEAGTLPFIGARRRDSYFMGSVLSIWDLGLVEVWRDRKSVGPAQEAYKDGIFAPEKERSEWRLRLRLRKGFEHRSLEIRFS